MKKQLEALLAKEFDPGFEARARFIFSAIERYKPKKILDAGCGRGFYSHCASLYTFVKQVEGFDLNETYLARAQKHCIDPKITLRKANIYSLPYANESFDFIIFSEVLEHIPNEKRALKELYRVLKKDGTIAVTVPHTHFPFLWDPLNWLLMRFFNTHIHKDIWWLAGIWADHERLYTRDHLLQSMKSASFIAQPIRPVISWCWPFSHFILYGIGKNIVERFGITKVDRFSFQNKSHLSNFVASFFRLPSKHLDHRIPLESSVNLLMIAKK